MFRFVSTWRLPAPPEQVWQQMADFEQWPAWWPGVSETALIAEGADDGVGRHGKLAVRSPLGFSLHFDIEITAAGRPHEAAVRVGGELAGTGSWVMTPTDDGAVARIGWDVDVTRRGARLLAGPLRRPMIMAHDLVMAAGERGLSAQLRQE